MKSIVFFFTLFFIFGCSDNENISDVLISNQEIEDLQFSKEEEKLARDVYLYCHGVYQNPIFLNISESEQKHMDNVTFIMSKYNVEDNSSLISGKFNNEQLQKLYLELTGKAAISLNDAIWVGATIEDLDINDIKGLKSHTSIPDIVRMYNVLSCGSQNHIRSFNQNLENLGMQYEAQFMDPGELEKILNTSRENCNF